MNNLNLLLLLTVVCHLNLAEAFYCATYTGTTSPTDPPLPDLPDQFQTIIEANIVNMNYSITAYEYFDNPGNRAAVWAKKNNTNNISLFDYANNQVIYIVGSACSARDLARDGNDVLFGNTTGGGIPHILTTAGALHFSKSAGQNYMGKTKVRGIQVDHWQSCLYWPQLRANFTVDYYFVVENWQDPIAYPRIPVRAYVKGVQLDFSGDLHPVEHFYDYIDFRTEITDMTVFQVPDGITCPGLVSKPLPQLPNYFHTKIETYSEGDTNIAEFEIWFDSPLKLIRYDQRLEAPVSGFQTNALVTVVNDYNYGIKYIKDKISGSCKRMPIPDTEISSTSTGTGATVLMKGASQTRMIDANFTYVGQRTVRGLPCNVYSAKRPFNRDVWATFELFVLADGFSLYPDDDDTASQGVPIQLTITNKTLGIKITRTFTTFSEDRPDISVYDVSSCYPENTTVLFNVKFQGEFKTGLRDQILREAQAKMAAVMQVSPIRVQNVRMTYDNSFVYVTATLLDTSPPLETIDGASKPQLSSQTAYENLWNAVYNGQLQLQTFVTFAPDPILFTAVDILVTYGHIYSQGIPQFTGQFSYHLESSVPSIQQVFNSHIWYDYEYQLVRYDVLVNSKPMSNIHDYNSGLAYVINRDTFHCEVSAISNSSCDVIVPSSTAASGYVVQLKNPIQFLDLTQNFLFIGQKTVRGVLCDAYEYVGNFDFGNGMQQAILQYYFMAQAWSEFSTNSGQAVPTQPISLLVTAADSSASTVYEFSDFNEQHPDLDNFNIRSCFPGNQQRDILIQFNQTYHPTLDTYLALFIKNAQMQLSTLTGVSPLRFQNVRITYDGPNTFYIATMVEQSPSILDFTRTGNKVGVYTMDATYVSIGSAIQCADVCRNMTGFQCLSFDYCPTTKQCQLSKRHTTDGLLLQTSGICDHYSKTVDSASTLEPSTDQAITILQDRIARGQLEITVLKADNSTVAYSAVFLSRDILRYDYGKESSTTLAHFTRTKSRALHIRDDPDARWIRYMPVSVDDCASKCLIQATFECQSYSYCPDMGLCLLSDLHPDENATSFEVSESCDLYSRKYTDMFAMYDGTYTIPDNIPTLTHISSTEICAKQCASRISPPCRSFDYCAETKTCVLSETHTADFQSKASPKNIYCSHFTKKYLFDFSMTPNKHLTSGPSRTVTNTTVENCAKLCVDSNGFSCASFIFCGHYTCFLFALHPRGVESQISANAVCDLYTRYLSATTSSSAHSSPEITRSSKYSAGSMAAVAVGTFIPGLILGAALLYFTKTKKLVELQHNHEMNILRQEET